VKSSITFALIAAAAAGAAVFRLGTTPVTEVHAQQPRPNIVFILSDDLDDRVSPYWERATAAGLDDPLRKTKMLVVDQGARFTNAFAPTPICCPARGTILTGKYGHNTGVLTNGGDQGGWDTFYQNGNEARTLAVYLQNAGYRTMLAGKYMNGIEADPMHRPAGWSEWYAFVDPNQLSYTGYGYQMNENGAIVQYGTSADDYATDVVARKAIDFIARAEADDDQPFLMYVAPTAPHLPLPPAPRHSDNPYTNASPPAPPNYLEPDLSDKSSWLRLSGDVRGREAEAWNPIDYPQRQGSLYALDDLVERVVNELAARGELANTYIVFTSDNGYNLGAHRLIHKMAPYEESIRIPLAIRGPGIPAGLTRTQMVAEIDVAPTFLGWAGVAVPSDVDGRPLQPLLGLSVFARWRSDLLLQYVMGGAANGIGAEIPPGVWVFSGQDIPTYRALRTTQYLYVEFYSDESSVHEYELYDVRRDPYQLVNLIATPSERLKYQELTARLQSRMEQLASCAGQSCRE
jgi:N-acetylglucosamine-6-sulfatase